MNAHILSIFNSLARSWRLGGSDGPVAVVVEVWRTSSGMLTELGRWTKKRRGCDFYVMSNEQRSALLAKLKHDSGLQEKLKSAADVDAAVALAKEAGSDVSKAD